MVTIKDIIPGSPAARAGIAPGDLLLTINGHDIGDVLDYRFYMLEETLSLTLRRPQGQLYHARIQKGEYEEPGLTFESYLMDRQRSCRNQCVFCFVDQMPKGLRPTLYFKDDDSRMSFLFGNYITLTNLDETEVERIIHMRISPINISVHATNPALRVRMMGNPKAGESLRHMRRLAEGGIKLNTQLVLCPGLNDGAALDESLRDLTALCPAMQSIAVVPVGLTGHREGLYPLRLFTQAEARQVLAQTEAFGEKMLARWGERIVYAADEWYLLASAGDPALIPPADFYGGFDQLENGVGLLALFQREFMDAVEEMPLPGKIAPATLVTGQAAAPFLRSLVGHPALSRWEVGVEAVPNRLFGETVTVAGLTCGGDIAAHLQGRADLNRVLVPASMLRREGDCFLDDMTVPELASALGCPVEVTEVDGGALVHQLQEGER